MSIYLKKNERNALIGVLIIASFLVGYMIFKSQIQEMMDFSPKAKISPKEFRLDNDHFGLYQINVQDLDNSVKSLSTSIKKVNAFVKESSISDNYAKLIIRTPKENFNSVENTITNAGVLKKSKKQQNLQSNEDNEYKSMLEVYRKLEEKYKMNLERNYSVNQLTMIEERLEQIQEKIRDLEKKVAKAELDRNWYNLKVLVVESNEQASSSLFLFKRGVSLLGFLILSALVGLIVIIVALIPVLGFVKLFGLILNTLGIKSHKSRRYYSRYKRKKKVRKPKKKTNENEKENTD